MTDLKARKEKWLQSMPLDDYQAHDPKTWPHQAARLIRLYEAEREAIMAAYDNAWALPLVLKARETRQATNAAWAEILGGEDGE